MSILQAPFIKDALICGVFLDLRRTNLKCRLVWIYGIIDIYFPLLASFLKILYSLIILDSCQYSSINKRLFHVTKNGYSAYYGQSMCVHGI